MKVLELAGIHFTFASKLDIICQNELALFERFDTPGCDHLYHVVESKLPPMPQNQPFYEGPLLRVWRNPAEMLTYHRLPGGEWKFCLQETPENNTIFVTPQGVHYTQNMWNVFDKIEFSSRLLEHDAVMLHSSYIIYKGQAIIFTAPSGVGKSTQAELWRSCRGAEVINGDRSILRPKDGRLWAFGTPFCGTSGICKDKSAPVRAIVTLEQGPENTVRPMTRRECTRFFLAQTTILRWKPEDVIGTMELWDRFIQQVPVLHLCCRPDEDAVRTLEQYLDSLQAKENNF